MGFLVKIFPVILLASIFGLSSCVNEVKNDATQGTAPKISVTYNILDSNNILSVKFRPLLSAPMASKYRLDWNFGDYSTVVQRFDTNAVNHTYQNHGRYIISLSLVDTVSKLDISEATDTIVLDGDLVDTSYLHQFKNIALEFTAACHYHQFGTPNDSTYNLTYDSKSRFDNYKIKWSDRRFDFTTHEDVTSNANDWEERIRDVSVACTISHGGNLVDSGMFLYHDLLTARSNRTDLVTNNWALLRFQYLPQIFMSNDSMVYTFSGNLLHFIVSEVQDSNFIGSAPGPVPTNLFTNGLKEIFWDKLPAPYLKIKFYR
jgi:hypothetical protein